MSDDKQKKGGLFGWLRGGKDKQKSSDTLEPESTESSSVDKPSVDQDSPDTQQTADDAAYLEHDIENMAPRTAEDDVNQVEHDNAVIEHSDELTQNDVEQRLDGDDVLSDGETSVETVPEKTVPAKTVATQEKPKGLFSRLKAGLSRTRAHFADGMASLFLGKKVIDDDLLEELETQLLLADLGVDATTEIIEALTERVERKQLKDPQALYQSLKQLLADMIEPVDQPLEIESNTPYVILMVGVNGVGKTTTIGKLAKQFQQQGKSVMLAAGDTFRAAAVEQLQVWGERNDIPVIAQHTGADSASVIFDAVQAAKSRGVDILIADTAGRLQTKFNLMDELTKVKRVMQKIDPTAPHEVMLTVDATTGQNALSQAEHFHKAVGVTGLTISKLDGTAKGGVVFAVARKMGIPIRYIGVGEGIDDLRTFVAAEFIDALFQSDYDSSVSHD